MNKNVKLFTSCLFNVSKERVGQPTSLLLRERKNFTHLKFEDIDD